MKTLVSCKLYVGQLYVVCCMLYVVCAAHLHGGGHLVLGQELHEDSRRPHRAHYCSLTLTAAAVVVAAVVVVELFPLWRSLLH